MGRVIDSMGRLIARYLEKPVSGYEPFTPSEPSALAASLKPGCLQGLRDKPASHDNLFHTVMGWVGARADVYKPEWDLLAACRS